MCQVEEHNQRKRVGEGERMKVYESDAAWDEVEENDLY